MAPPVPEKLWWRTEGAEPLEQEPRSLQENEEQERMAAEEQAAEAERLRISEEEAAAEKLREEQEAALRADEEERKRQEAELAEKREREEAEAAAAEAAKREAEAARQEMAKQAAEARKQAVQKFLADYKFKDINTGRRSLTKTTYALHEAAKRNDLEMVKMLIEQGANVEQINSRKQTALQRATQEDKKGSHQEVIGVLKSLSTEQKSRVG